MNSIILSSKKKLINLLNEYLLEIDKNVKNSKHELQWFSDSSKLDSILLNEKSVYYIVEGNIIIYIGDELNKKDNTFFISPRNILLSMNEFFEILNYKPINSSYQIINLNTSKSRYRLVFSFTSVEEKFLKNLDYRKLYYCIDCNLCQTVCPIYKVIPDFYPIEDIKRQIMEKNMVSEPLCTSCKACETVCPANIKMSEYLLNLKFKREKTFVERILIMLNNKPKYQEKVNNYINNRLK